MTDNLVNPVGVAVRTLRHAAGMSMADLAKAATISKGYVGFIEAGANTPTTAVVAALDNALGAGGLLRALAHEDDEMKRRSLLAAIAAVAAGAGEYARLLEGVTRTAVTRVGQSDVDAVAQSVTFATELDLKHGGGAAAGPGRAVLGWAVQLLDASMSDKVRLDLSSAVASLADRVAWSSYDAGQDAAARSLYGIALRIARQGNDVNLIGHILLDESTRAAHNRRFDDAATLLRGALEEPGLLPAVRSNLGMTYARHIASLGMAREALDETGRALDLIADIDTGDVPIWSQPFLSGPAHLMSVAARPQLFAGDYDSAIAGFTAALQQLDAGRGRGRAYALALLALAYLRAGYPDCAEDAAHTLIASTNGLQSARVAGHVGTLASELKHAGRADLAHEVSALAVHVTPAER